MKEIGYPSQTAKYKRLLARIALSEGDRQAAERYLQEALDIYEVHGLRGWKSVTLGELGYALVSSGDYATAVQLAEVSLRICRIRAASSPYMALWSRNQGVFFDSHRELAYLAICLTLTLVQCRSLNRAVELP